MSGSFCREKFSILVNQSTSLDRPRIAPSTQDTTQWTLVDTVASTEDITVEQINIGPLFGNGIFIAFVNTGACMELSHVKVSYKYCPAVVADFAEFGRTHTGATAASIINQEGVCVENAIQNGKVVFLCHMCWGNRALPRWFFSRRALFRVLRAQVPY